MQPLLNNLYSSNTLGSFKWSQNQNQTYDHSALVCLNIYVKCIKGQWEDS